ncbi:MAG: sigma 54-interacting transcriptional regulator [Anaerolineae bacterium]|nr:sigma 54-interacting transcriptional regulator [Anaerolineae bacterium]MDH7472661.1 sigma 54-interacting transcriptional regulator [Anaerolineae bacterium]
MLVLNSDMLPLAYPYDRRALLAAWQQFTQQGTCNFAALDPAVMRSWQRCWQIGLDPYVSPMAMRREDAEALERRRHAHFDLIAIARPFMEDIYQFVGERDIVVYLADRDSCILDAVGDPSLRELLQGRGFDCGLLLSEELCGTNATALALNEGVPVQVAGPEHYCVAFHALTGTAAPVLAPAGELIGVLSIVTLESKGHPHTLGIVMAAAKAIENQLQADLSLTDACHHLAELNAALQAMSKGVVFLDTYGRVTHLNARAGEILGFPHRKAMGRELTSLVRLPSEVEGAIARQVALAEKEVVFRTVDGDRSRPCLASVDILKDGSQLLGLILMLEHTAEVRRLVHRMVGAQAHFTFDDILCQDAEMKRVVSYARIAAQGDSNVLLLGESGTGKEMFAQAIHNGGRRAKGPFIAINCAAIPRELMASELFGYEGAFAGAGKEGRPGKFELAEGGTIFFDNVDCMPLDMQAGLLRVIDTKEIVRLGGTRVITLNVRIIAASSNLDLAGEVQRGNFRADLFYRLHVLTLTIPPLRERGNDILLLVAHLIEKFSRRLGKTVTVSPGAMAVLQSYHWPGNVRELENVLERAMHMVSGSELMVEHLPYELRMATIGGTDEAILTLREAERQAIIRAGRALRGNTTKMAEALGIGRTTLWRRMKDFNLSPESFRG